MKLADNWPFCNTNIKNVWDFSALQDAFTMRKKTFLPSFKWHAVPEFYARGKQVLSVLLRTACFLYTLLLSIRSNIHTKCASFRPVLSLAFVPCWQVETLQTYGHIGLLIEIYYVCADGCSNVMRFYQTIAKSAY